MKASLGEKFSEQECENKRSATIPKHLLVAGDSVSSLPLGVSQSENNKSGSFSQSKELGIMGVVVSTL